MNRYKYGYAYAYYDIAHPLVMYRKLYKKINQLLDTISCKSGHYACSYPNFLT